MASELIPLWNIHVNTGGNNVARLAGSTTNVVVALSGSPISPENGIRLKAAITSATVPLSYYGVNTTNNVVSVTETNGVTPLTFDVTLEPGQYTNVSFITMVNDVMTTASLASGYAFTYNSSLSTDTGRISFKITDVAPNAGSINYQAATTTATIPLGLPPKNLNGVITTYTALVPWLSYNVLNIQGPYEIHIRCDQFPTNVYEVRSQSISTILAIIPITGLMFQTTVYLPAIPKIFADVGSRADFLNIRVTDQDGNLLDLNGQPVFFDLQIYRVA